MIPRVSKRPEAIPRVLKMPEAIPRVLKELATIPKVLKMPAMPETPLSSLPQPRRNPKIL